MTTDKKIIIAIDGHSGSGKSTFARDLARALGYTVINTGAMYRAITLHALRNDLLDPSHLVPMLDKIDITLTPDDIFLNGEAVGHLLHSIEISNHVSAISAIPQVREKLLDIQRAMGRKRGVVMEGRDIGTVVFPDAELKIFLTADPHVRALRRADDMPGISVAEIERNIRQRDRADESRPVSPLSKASDAIVLDNTRLTPAQQLEWALERFHGL